MKKTGYLAYYRLNCPFIADIYHDFVYWTTLEMLSQQGVQ